MNEINDGGVNITGDDGNVWIWCPAVLRKVAPPDTSYSIILSNRAVLLVVRVLSTLATRPVLGILYDRQ